MSDAILVDNPLLTTGLVLWLVGIVINASHSLLVFAWKRLVEFFVVSIEVDKNDEMFPWLLTWLQKNNELSQRSPRSIDAHSSRRPPPSKGQYGRHTVDISVDFSQAPDTLDRISFLHNNKTYRVWVQRVKSGKTETAGWKFQNGAYKHDNGGEQQLIRLSMLSTDTSVLKALMAQVVEDATSPYRDMVQILTLGDYGWSAVDSKAPRTMASVVLPKGVAPRIVNDMLEFLAAERWYIDRSLPYRRGYLFEGLPGSGKTTTIFGLASLLDLKLCVLSLASSKLDDQKLVGALCSLPANSLVLIEDIDAAFPRRGTDEDDEKKKADAPKSTCAITLSGLLQALDGVASADGRLVIMSTNHADRLDPALIRPGRVDMRVRFEHATKEQVRRLFGRFYTHKPTLAVELVKRARKQALADGYFKETEIVEDCSENGAEAQCDRFVKALGPVFPETSMASFQGHFLKHRKSANEAIARASELLDEIKLAREHQANKK